MRFKRDKIQFLSAFTDMSQRCDQAQCTFSLSRKNIQMYCTSLVLFVKIYFFSIHFDVFLTLIQIPKAFNSSNKYLRATITQENKKTAVAPKVHSRKKISKFLIQSHSFSNVSFSLYVYQSLCNFCCYCCNIPRAPISWQMDVTFYDTRFQR